MFFLLSPALAGRFFFLISWRLITLHYCSGFWKSFFILPLFCKLFFCVIFYGLLKFLFIYLAHWVLAEAGGLFRCGLWNLAP